MVRLRNKKFLYLSTFRLKEVADKIKRHGHVSQPALQNLRNVFVTQLVVGPNHIALLLEVKLLMKRSEGRNQFQSSMMQKLFPRTKTIVCVILVVFPK